MSPLSEDELRARLKSVEPSEMQTRLAETVIQKGQSRRRRHRWVFGIAAAAAVGVIGVGAVSLNGHSGPDSVLPATPVPSGSRTMSPSTPTISQSPGPSSSATSTPTGSTPTPPAITFLHEGVRGDGESTSDWLPVSSLAGLCDEDAWRLAGTQGAVERRAIAGGGGDGGPTAEALFVFADADGAVAFMGQLRQTTRGCTSTMHGAARGLVEALPGPWGEGASLTILEGQGTTGGPVVLAVRSGRAVALSIASGPFATAARVDPALIRSARPGVEHLAPQLCRYTAAGC